MSTTDKVKLPEQYGYILDDIPHMRGDELLHSTMPVYVAAQMLAMHEQGRLAGLEERDKLAKDAARYRYLRNYYVPADGRDDSDWDDLDEAVMVGGEKLDLCLDVRINGAQAVRAAASIGAKMGEE